MGPSSCCQVCFYCALCPPTTSHFFRSIFLSSFLSPTGLHVYCLHGLSNIPLLPCAVHEGLPVCSQTARQTCPVLCAAKLVQSPKKVSHFKPPVFLPAIYLYLCTASISFQWQSEACGSLVFSKQCLFQLTWTLSHSLRAVQSIHATVYLSFLWKIKCFVISDMSFPCFLLLLVPSCAWLFHNPALSCQMGRF